MILQSINENAKDTKLSIEKPEVFEIDSFHSHRNKVAGKNSELLHSSRWKYGACLNTLSVLSKWKIKPQRIECFHAFQKR